MKYYSELLDQFFDTENEVLDSEKKYYDLIAQKNTQTETSVEAIDSMNKKQISKEKKELSEAIEKADKDLDAAYAGYEETKQQILLMKKNTDKECHELLKEAKAKLRLAQDAKYAKVAAFNEKYGPYSVSYTGDRALKEMNRHLSWFDDLLNSFWF